MQELIVILCFSGHKICGPTGIGILYGKESYNNYLNQVWRND
jgi:cysteine desulfurase/selenocysteine lyase